MEILEITGGKMTGTHKGEFVITIGPCEIQCDVNIDPGEKPSFDCPGSPMEVELTTDLADIRESIERVIAENYEQLVDSGEMYVEFVPWKPIDVLKPITAKVDRVSCPEAKFENVYCSQCGREFGPGNHGYSHCKDHKNR
jgi:hypothetical protein